MVRKLLLAALILGVLVDGFFALINFYPVAPRRSRGPARTVLVTLDAEQGRWFQENVLDEYNDEHDTNLQLRRVDDDDLLDALTRKDVLLAALPSTEAERARASGLVRPFTDVASPDEIGADFAGVRRSAMAAAEVEGRPYFLPRMSVLDVAAYRISRVLDAEQHWILVRPQIEAALRAVNGRGLPVGYDLEQSPDQWDTYDLFVMGFYWAHRSYQGRPARPRIAHRTGENADGELDILGGLYRMGATDGTIARYDSRASEDYFAWEALDRRSGVYAERMYGEKPYDDEAVLAGLRSGELFFASVDQMEAFTLHGGGHRGARAQVDDPSDLGFTELPDGASLELDRHGRPVRLAPSYSFREDWVWALPAGGPEPRLAYDLVKYIWTREVHVRECEALGMMPLRSDVIRERASIFRLSWMSDVFDAGFDQLERAEPVPVSLVQRGVGSVYAQLWTRIVAEREGTAPGPDGDGLASILRAPPPPRSPEEPESAPAVADSQPAAPGAGDEGASEAESQAVEADWRGRVVLQGVDGGGPPAAKTPQPGGRR